MAATEIICKRCQAADYVKNGIVRGLQRYRCGKCGYNFTLTPPRGKPAAMKAMAVLLYGMGNASFGMIARLLGVSDVAVLNWVRDAAERLPDPDARADVVTRTIDEMWHFLKKTQKLWVWRAYDPAGRRTVAWVPPGVGGRDDATYQQLLDKIGVQGKTFITDDWEGYHRLIPEEQILTGKDLTYPIEQDNSNVRHYLARFRRRTKVVSKLKAMVGLSLRLYHHLHDDPQNFAALAAVFLSIFR